MGVERIDISIEAAQRGQSYRLAKSVWRQGLLEIATPTRTKPCETHGQALVKLLQYLLYNSTVVSGNALSFIAVKLASTTASLRPSQPRTTTPSQASFPCFTGKQKYAGG